jgi:hypothetical protein
MDTGSQRVASAFRRMQQRDRLGSRAAGRLLLVLCASAGDLGKHSCIALGKRKRDERETGLAALRASLLSRREAISRVRDKVTR